MSEPRFSKTVQPIQDTDGEKFRDFCPDEVVDKIVDLFIVRERDGRTVEKQLGIRRPLFEKGLRHAINRYRDPQGPKSMQRAGSMVPIRRTA